MLKAHGDWMPLGGADEQKPAPEGTVEAWGRVPDNPLGGWYGLKKGLRGRFGVYMPPLLEALGLAELTHDAKNNRMRAICRSARCRGLPGRRPLRGARRRRTAGRSSSCSAPAARSVQELADALPISRPAVSRHLRLLKRAGLVVEEPRRDAAHLPAARRRGRGRPGLPRARLGRGGRALPLRRRRTRRRDRADADDRADPAAASRSTARRTTPSRSGPPGSTTGGRPTTRSPPRTTSRSSSSRGRAAGSSSGRRRASSTTGAR